MSDMEISKSTRKSKVVGGFNQDLWVSSANYALTGDWQGGKKIFVNVNQTVGGRKDGDRSDVAPEQEIGTSGTELRIVSDIWFNWCWWRWWCRRFI